MGFAVGDETTGVVSPLEVVPYDGVASAARHVTATAERLGAGCVVLGLPALADGSVGSAAARTEALAEELRSLGVKVELQSEYLSTHEARHRARAAGRAAGRPVDDLAALVLLEEYLATHPPTPDTAG